MHHLNQLQQLELVHSDLLGPSAPRGVRGEKYLITLVDDYSGLGEVFPLAKKSDAFATLTTAIIRWGAMKLGLRAWLTDRGREYMSGGWESG